MERAMKTAFVGGLLSALLGVVSSAGAYGPISINTKGQARILQDFDGNSSNGTHQINYFPENINGCGSRTNAQMIDFVATSLSQIPSASIDSVDVTSMSLNPVTSSMTDNTGALVTEDITGSNYTDVYVVNGDSASSKKVTNDQFTMLFDSDGTITSALDGVANRCIVLGFAGMVLVNDSSTVEKSQMVINCAHDSGSICPGASATDTDVKTVILHEFLHGVGLDHSQAGVDAAGTSSTSDDSPIATMYPVLANASQMSTMNKDDVVGLASLYSNSSLSSSFGTVSGTVVDKNGTEMPCVEVIATNTSDSTDIVTTITGYAGNSPTSDFPDDCTSNCGAYTLKGLKNGATYQLKAANIHDEFTGGSSIGRCDPPKLYDLNGDSTNSETETVTLSSTVTSTSGQTTSGVTITTSAVVTSSSGSSGSSGSSSSGEESSSLCSLVRDAALLPGLPQAFAIFMFTAFALLATGRRCATRRR